MDTTFLDFLKDKAAVYTLSPTTEEFVDDVLYATYSDRQLLRTLREYNEETLINIFDHILYPSVGAFVSSVMAGQLAYINEDGIVDVINYLDALDTGYGQAPLKFVLQYYNPFIDVDMNSPEELTTAMNILTVRDPDVEGLSEEAQDAIVNVFWNSAIPQEDINLFNEAFENNVSRQRGGA